MKYFIGLDKMTLDELEVLRLLCRYSNYETCIAGYTVNQLVVNSDSRLKLTTQKVRTILKKFEKEGYIKLLTSGSKGKESTLKLTIKQQLFNNNKTNKDEGLQRFESEDNDYSTTIQQLSNNTTKKKNKENNNIYKDLAFTDLYLVKVTDEQYNKLIEVANGNINLVHNKMLSLEVGIANKNKKYLNYKNHYLTLRNWISKEKEKTPTGIGARKNNYNSSICNNAYKNTEKIQGHKFV